MEMSKHDFFPATLCVVSFHGVKRYVEDVLKIHVSSKEVLSA